MSIKGFIVNGSTVKYDYDALDNKPVIPSGGGGEVSDELKAALIQLAQKIAYVDANGASYYQDLYEALYGETPVITYSIINNLTDVVNSNGAVSVVSGSSYSGTLTAATGYTISSVTITMGGVDITSTAYSSGTITIASATGNIVITAVATGSSSALFPLPTITGYSSSQGTADISSGNHIEFSSSGNSRHISISKSAIDSYVNTSRGTMFSLSQNDVYELKVLNISYSDNATTENYFNVKCEGANSYVPLTTQNISYSDASGTIQDVTESGTIADAGDVICITITNYRTASIEFDVELWINNVRYI